MSSNESLSEDQWIAVLDANVLIPAALRDTLLRAAAAGMYSVRWSDEILAEVNRNLVVDVHLTEAQAQHIIIALTTYFPDAAVTEYAHLLDAMPNHPKDRHVLAAAVAAGAQIIVTQNLRDFPQEALAPLHVEAQSPDVFLTRLFEMNTDGMARILVQQAEDLHRPARTVEQVLDLLALDAPMFAGLVRAELAG
jgi:predicted nucleic acid-binding protein